MVGAGVGAMVGLGVGRAVVGAGVVGLGSGDGAMVGSSSTKGGCASSLLLVCFPEDTNTTAQTPTSSPKRMKRQRRGGTRGLFSATTQGFLLGSGCTTIASGGAGKETSAGIRSIRLGTTGVATTSSGSVAGGWFRLVVVLSSSLSAGGSTGGWMAMVVTLVVIGIIWSLASQ